jgi:hypothetical protein
MNKYVGWIVDGNHKNTIGNLVVDEATDILCKLRKSERNGELGFI